MLHPANVTRRFIELYEEIGLPPVRLHDLRHGAATLAHAAGADLKDIQEMLGHSSITITADTYTSPAPRSRRRHRRGRSLALGQVAWVCPHARWLLRSVPHVSWFLRVGSGQSWCGVAAHLCCTATRCTMYNVTMTTQPTRAMWWAEIAVFLIVAATTLTGIASLVSLAAGGRHVTVDGGPSVLLIALSISVGIFVSGRFRAWGLRRRAACLTQP